MTVELFSPYSGLLLTTTLTTSTTTPLSRSPPPPSPSASQNRVHLLRKLRSFDAKMETLELFYVENLLTVSFSSWYGSLSLKSLSQLRRIVHLCEKIVGKQLGRRDTIVSTRTLSDWCRKMMLDDSHI